MATELTIPPSDIPGQPVPYRQDQAVLDGDRDFDRIQDALDAAETGSQVAVGPGTFSENVTITTDDVSLVGAYRGTVIDGEGADHAIRIDADRVTVSQLAARTDAGSGHNAVEVTAGTNNPRVQFVVVLQSGNHGIAFLSGTMVQEATLLGNTIEGADAVGANLINSEGMQAMITSIVKRGTAEPVGGDAMVVEGNENTVLGLSAVDPGGHILDVDGADSHLEGIIGRDAGEDGIELTGAGNTTLTGFRVIDAAINGILVEPSAVMSISDGVVSGSTQNDIQASAGEAVYVNGVIYDTISAPGNVIINGRQEGRLSEFMGGSNGSLEPTDLDIQKYVIEVDPQGTGVDVQGIDNIADVGTEVTLLHAGGEAFDIVDDSGSASNPIKTDDGNTITLDANDEMVRLEYDGTVWRVLATNLQ